RPWRSTWARAEQPRRVFAASTAKKSVDQFTNLRETGRGPVQTGDRGCAGPMFNFLAATFGRPQARAQPAAVEMEHTSALNGAVRFRPRLTAQVRREHAV